jgi:DNA-binding IclR family transcriptional regulator
MVFLDMVQAVHPLQYVVELNSWMPVHAGATGLAILAFLPEAERERIYQRGLDRLTGATLVTRAALEGVVATIRERGHVCSRGQRTAGAVGIAAPIYDSVGDVYGDVTITIPEQRFDERLEGVLATALRRTTAAVSDELRRAGCRRG